MKVLVALGTRPEAVKLAPVILDLRARGIDVSVLFSRQHEELAKSVFDIFKIEPEYVFAERALGFSLPELSSSYVRQAGEVIAKVSPDLVVVQGDTTTAFASALAAYYQGCPVGHVEAGLRTHNPYAPFPEENHRKMIAVLSVLHFAPSPAAVEALRAEGVPLDHISMTGNTVIDAMRWILDHVPNPYAAGLGGLPTGDTRPYVLVTAHRRENFAQAHQLYFEQLNELAAAQKQMQFVYVMHPNPNVQELASRLLRCENIFRVQPVDYSAFIHLMKGATLIVTDSGGVQEESAFLGKPTLVIREVTERKELQQGGNLLVVGQASGRLKAEATRLLTDPGYYQQFSRVNVPYGTGDAARQIVERIEAWWRLKQNA